jgi:AcrR family transcriptional regulator
MGMKAWVEAKACCRVDRAGLRRRTLIDTARRLFIDNGFHATGIAQIARESGIAVGQIYRDFDSKEAIVAALVQGDCAKMMRADALRAAIDARCAEQVRGWLYDFIEPDDDLGSDKMFAEIVAEASRNARIAAIFAGIDSQLRADILAALALLAPGPALQARREVLADAMVTISLGMLHHRLMRPTLDVAPLVATFRTILDEQISLLGSAESAR